MISFRKLLEKASAINWKTWIWIGLGLVAVPALRIYYVQELLAALIAFSILFVALYAAVFAVFLLVRASKPILAWAIPKVGRVVHWGVETVEDVIANPVGAKANPVWAKSVPLWAKAVPHRFGRVVRTSVEAVEGVVADPAWTKAAQVWAKSVPVWAKAVPHGFRKQQLKLNENYKIVRLRFACLRPSHVYSLSLQKGGAALTVGLRTRKRISSELGSWLTQRVNYSDLIRLPSISRARLSARGSGAHRRR